MPLGEKTHCKIIAKGTVLAQKEVINEQNRKIRKHM